MTTLLERPRRADVPEADAAMRRSLRMQIARLERELIAMPGAAPRDRPGAPVSAPPARPGAHRTGARPDPPGERRGGATLPSAGELERIRDDLVRRIQERRFTGGEEQERKRRLREEMLLDPAGHFGVSVANAEVGEPGCTRWASWFRLTISSGCP